MYVCSLPGVSPYDDYHTFFLNAIKQFKNKIEKNLQNKNNTETKQEIGNNKVIVFIIKFSFTNDQLQESVE